MVILVITRVVGRVVVCVVCRCLNRGCAKKKIEGYIGIIHQGWARAIPPYTVLTF